MERKEIKIDLRQTNAVDFAIAAQLFLLFLGFGIAALAGLVYRLDAIKNVLGL